ncbi:hexose kinase [Leifsonia sp. fls2-241-R2A-40a]|uniref:hexose kinase n=1 Tax=Leifsonia sp. fls2-241-R2A-40a TaxID=3040290 RepID=UPI00254CC624|nr:hexose kinase [Leifsonia sp. fls2-241-R2A-40a]
MRIGILGTGAMTIALGARLVRAGHEVLIGSRDPERSRAVSEELGAAGAGDYRFAARADVVILALHDTEVLRIAESLADVLAGAVVIDLNNPLDPPSFESRYAGSESLGERLAAVAPGARVVKAFNTVYAEWFAEGADAGSPAVQVFVASDDEDAKSTVTDLVRQLDAEPVDAGPLRAARQLESLAGFEVSLVDRGFAPFVGFRLVAGQQARDADGVRPRISVVGPNPAMDRTEAIAEFRPNEVNRATVSSPRAGGKSFIVARALRRLGRPVALYGFLGGTTGEYLRSECAELGIHDRHVTIVGETRINTIVVDGATGGATVVNEPGPTVSEAEADALVRAVGAGLAADDLLLLSGSLTHGLRPGFYAELVELAHSRGARTVVDAAGDVLVRAAAARPWALKCNLEEFAAIMPDAPRQLAMDADRDRLLRAMRALTATGVELVIVTLGADGLLAATASEAIQVAAPRVIVKNPTGSGDTLLAAFAAACADGEPLPDALRFAVAAASANAAVLVPDLGPDPQLTELVKQTVVHRLSTGTAS